MEIGTSKPPGAAPYVPLAVAAGFVAGVGLLVTGALPALSCGLCLHAMLRGGSGRGRS